MRSRSVRRLAAMWLLGAFGIVLQGCTDARVSADEVLPALRSLGYTYKWRSVPRPPGVDKVVAGRASDRKGNTLDFVVAVYDDYPKGQSLPVVPHSDGSSCGNYTLIDNSADRYVAGKLRRQRLKMSWRIERALDRREPGYRCMG